MKKLDQPFLSFYIATCLLATAVLAVVLDVTTAEQLSREGNLIEDATVVLYLCVVIHLLFVASGRKRFRYHSAFVVLLFALRELDMHSRMTSLRINNFNYYIEPTIPLVERFVVGAVLLVCMYALIRYMINYCRELVSGLRNRHAPALTVTAALLITLIAKLLDSAPRILRESFATTLSNEVKTPMRVIEEMLEFGIPLLMFLACLQYWTLVHKRQQKT